MAFPSVSFPALLFARVAMALALDLGQKRMSRREEW
jgi:hypothetical protein